MMWRGICVHHTAVPASTPARYIRAYHMEKRGFADIGYHWVLVHLPCGWVVEKGRETSAPGAHCPALNRSHIAVAVGGNYEMDPVTPALVDALSDLLADLCSQHDIAPADITYHQRHADTACPGRAIVEAWPHIVEAVADRLPQEGAEP